MLGGVPDDEAEEIRKLLDDGGIDYYEVPASFLGISPAALWLRDSDRLPEAKALIDGYQFERAKRARSEYESLKSRGEQQTLLDSAKNHPFRLLAYLVAMAAILYLSLSPFLYFGK